MARTGGGNPNPKAKWTTREERDAVIGENKAYSQRSARLSDESRLEAMELLLSKINAERDISFFAEIMNGNPMTDNEVAKVLGLNLRTLTAARLARRTQNRKAMIKTHFCYRAMKHLKPEIIYFLLNDKYFDERDELRREFREAFNSISEVNALEIKD